jgi:hypothetical protein
MTMTTVFLEMTIRAEFVLLLFSLQQPFRVRHIMAVPTILILMAINTLEPEQINMFIVIKSHYGTRLIRSVIYLGGWNRDYRMRNAYNI